MQGIPTRFAATGADAAVSITRRAVNHRIGLSLSFPRDHLDADAAIRAFQAIEVPDEEPHAATRRS